MKIKLTKEQSDLINQTGTVVNTGGDTYMYLPYWFKKIDEETYEQMSFDKLPKDLKDRIRHLRGDSKQQTK